MPILSIEARIYIQRQDKTNRYRFILDKIYYSTVYNGIHCKKLGIHIAKKFLIQSREFASFVINIRAFMQKYKERRKTNFQRVIHRIPGLYKGGFKIVLHLC